MPKQTKTASRKSKNSKFQNILAYINPQNPKRRFLLFIVVFALIGGGYMAYRSFAAISTPVFYMRNSNNAGFADISFAYGNQGDEPLACDWDGNGTSTIGIHRGGEFYLRNSNTTGVADVSFTYGNAGDKPICGDWDGNGTDTVGVFQPASHKFQLRNSNTQGVGEVTIPWGDASDIPLACDWDGNGKTDIGVYRPSNATFYLSFSPLGWTNYTIPYGNPGDIPVCGNWDGKGGDGIGVYRPSNANFYLSDTTNPSNVNYQFLYGNGGDKPIAGDWDGNKTATVGVYRNTAPPAAPTKTTYTCVGDKVVEMKDKATCDAVLAYARIAREQAATTPAPPASPTAPAGPAGTPTIQAGASGAAVANLQQRLANRGFWIGTTGNFDDATVTVVKWFQGARGITADGIVGPQTWGNLAAAEAEGWRFQANPPPASNPVSVGQPTMTPELAAYLLALKAAEDQARREELDRTHNPVSAPRSDPIGYCELWKLSGGQWSVKKTYYVITKQDCWAKSRNNAVEMIQVDHIDWTDKKSDTYEIWPIDKGITR